MSDNEAVLLYWGALAGALVGMVVLLAAVRLKEWTTAVVAGVAAVIFCGAAASLGWVMWR